jgi:AbrB family looped-hinge helix DNA binding protein
MKTRHKVVVGSNGRILLPLVIRREMGINPGDSVVVYQTGAEVRIAPLDHQIQECQRLVKKYNEKNISLVKSLKETRRRDHD